MKYFLVHASNGLCGCDEEWITETEKEDLDFYSDVIEAYTYEGGYAGMENDDIWEAEEEGYDPYYETIADNTTWEEITEEEFIRLRDEEDYEVR